MKLNDKLIHKLYKKALGKTVDLNLVQLDTVNDTGVCVGMRPKDPQRRYSEFIFQRVLGGWAFTEGREQIYYNGIFDPNANITLQSRNLWVVRIDDFNFKSILNQIRNNHEKEKD